ncbi:hypothetical protein KI387_009003, partial [Taxus chinensis]
MVEEVNGTAWGRGPLRMEQWREGGGVGSDQGLRTGLEDGREGVRGAAAVQEDRGVGEGRRWCL